MLRQQIHLKTLSQKYPDIWRLVDEVRFSRRRAPDEWPQWCFLPLYAAAGILRKHLGFKEITPFLVGEAQRLAGLAAWRATQGIYRFDPDLYQEIADTPVEELPVDVFFCLPEWCVNIEIPYLREECRGLSSFYFYLDRDPKNRIPELRFLLDFDAATYTGLFPVVIPVKSENLMDNIHFLQRSVAEVVPELEDEGFARNFARFISGCLSAVIYLCSVNADVRPVTGKKPFPERPRPVRTKKGYRIFPASQPTVWETGYRIGLQTVNLIIDFYQFICQYIF